MRTHIAGIIFLTLAACAPNSAPFEGTQWTVINYWAVWCTPCREEIPELNALNERNDVQVLGVNFDGKVGAALASDAAALAINFSNIDDPSAYLGTERPSVLPTTLILDPSGALIETLAGPQTKTGIEAIISAANSP